MTIHISKRCRMILHSPTCSASPVAGAKCPSAKMELKMMRTIARYFMVLVVIAGIAICWPTTLLGVTGSLSPAGQARPIPKSVNPNIGEPDDRFTVTIKGDVLSAVTSCSFGQNIDVLSLKVRNDGEIICRIYIHKDAARGPRAVTLTNAAGNGILT